ncbi:MAG: glucoamylase family protein, partial [Alphaproteobacteria bacterium]
SVRFLAKADSYHGVFPHFLNGETGRTIPFSRKDDGGDLVETSFLIAGLLCARQYFDGADSGESELRQRIDALWHEIEWDWHRRDGSDVLYWHWSPNNGWSMNHQIRGWNECLITYVLAASAPRYAVPPEVYHRGWATDGAMKNGRVFHGIELPLGPDRGGPLFFAHYSFLGLDPRGLQDRYADYWQQNLRHVLINREHCLHNPRANKGYGADCWGLTACDNYEGYNAHAPDNDLGVIAPTAALSSFPYTPDFSMQALRHFYERMGAHIWGEFGFKDAFSEERGWVADSYLAIDQGPIVAMIENHRSGLLWKLFMSCPEVRYGLVKLGFTSPHLVGTG